MSGRGKINFLELSHRFKALRLHLMELISIKKIMGSHHDVAELNIADSKTLHFILHAASLLNSLPIFSVFIKFFLFCFLRFSGEKI